MLDTPRPASLEVRRLEPDTVSVRIGGDWTLPGPQPGLAPVREFLAREPALKRLQFELDNLGGWNSRLVSLMMHGIELCQSRGLEWVDAGLPDGLRRLLRLAMAVPESKDAQPPAAPPRPLERLGESALRVLHGARDGLTFLGETLTAGVRLLRGRAQFRWSDAFLAMQRCGPEALGVVALINFLVGVILAFVGSIQLIRFGASVYVADLVAIAMVREMGCIMTGIIICGRTGAAFAAELGTMNVNEEIDAFRTFGFSPIEFLVLPRMVALLLMMPLLCVFADVIGIAGGVAIVLTMLDLTLADYLGRTVEAIDLTSFLLGIFKGACFGALVALTGCLRGLQSGRNAAAVGLATTSAVVTGITAIIAADAVFAVICHALGI